MIKILFILLFLNGIAAAENMPEPKSWTIQEIKKRAVVGEKYWIQGYVVLKGTCPPCPEGAMCKPCMYDDNIVVSENNQLREFYNDIKDSELIIFTKQTDAFELGKRYRFQLRVMPTKSTSMPINDLELVDWNKNGR